MGSTTADKTSGKLRRKRRCFRYSLSTLLGLVTLTAVVLALVEQSDSRMSW
jgi:hypothetical protein